MTYYQHTQRGMVLILAVIIGTIGIITTAIILREPEALRYVIMAIGIALFIPLGLTFTSLTVSVIDDMLEWRFGSGLLTFRRKLRDIESVEAVRNPAWYGWGIRITPSGLLYNVAGREGVEIKVSRPGRRPQTIRIGTDEPEALKRAIEEGRARVNGNAG